MTTPPTHVGAAALRAAAQATLGADAQLSDTLPGEWWPRPVSGRIDLSLAGIAARVLDDRHRPAGRAVVVSDAARVVRVSGPLVEIDVAAALAMHELVDAGNRANPRGGGRDPR